MSVSTTSSAALKADAELAQQLAGPGVAMRLEHDDDAPVDAGARRGEDGGDLGRVMTVVVHDHHAVFLPEPLESPLGALELRERSRNRVERNADLEADGHRRQRVQQVVPARHLQPQLAELDVPASEAATVAAPPASSSGRPAREPNASSAIPCAVTLADAWPSAVARP